MSFRLICASFALLTALHEQSAMAQEGTGTDVSGSAEIATDYRFRGYSRSEGEPVGQGVLDVTLPAGVRTSVFAGGTGVLTKSNPAFGSVQTQVYAGFEHEVGAFHLTLGGRGYLFPNVRGRDYYEAFGAGQTQLGPLSAKLGVAFAPDQRNYGGKSGIYVYSDLDTGIPGTPLSLASHVGWEDNAFFRDKLDWSLGVTYVKSPFSLALDYIDTNRAARFLYGNKVKDGAGATLVLRLGAAF